MKRFFYFVAPMLLSSASVMAQDLYQKVDTTKIYELDAVEVVTTYASRTTPVAQDNLSKQAIVRSSYGADMPSALALTPSLIATNETGVGIGATAIRLRGTDATRINVTINGVAMNNPDSHSMYWYDTPDLISSVGSVQVQRGAGVSTNGSGAFGGAVSMTTDALSPEFRGSASLSYGSYNTNKQGVNISSGLIADRWVVDARLTHIGSDGYIERGSTDLKSYMAQVGYYGTNTKLKLLSFGGSAKTYLTYNGVSREDMAKYGRRYHDSGQYIDANGEIAYYDDQTDNYLQFNNQLVVNHTFNQNWMLNATLFYTYGYGYYNQYRDDEKLAKYLNLERGGRADMIRHKYMLNHNGGANIATNYRTRTLDLVAGGSWSRYTSPHWGTISWVDGVEDVAGHWYDNDVVKDDANLFVRANWVAMEGSNNDELHLFGDLQYRYVGYKTWGTNDNAIEGEDGSYSMQPIDVDKQYNFFNPRVGISYVAQKHNLFASVAVAHREPTRSDFTDRYMFAKDDSYPEPERLTDFEVGYTYSAPRLSLGVNLYYMLYHNQLVATGMVNDGDDALNVNVDKSYRRGVELMASFKATKWLTLSANSTLSQNKIENYVDQMKDSPTFGQNLGTKTISYSPSVVGAFIADIHHKGWSMMWHTQYVGKQYFTNNETEALSLDAYCVTNLDLSYTMKLRDGGSVRMGMAVNNLFSTLYESNGYGYSYMWDGVRYDEAFFFPQAPINVLANVTVNF
ncbi:MAG: TonB-dependent receptor plug domain-containing protein [Alistipes sp.]|nr:TonB-dependent receptor plug domain-containing protein [Alistipes sp.]